MRIEKLVNTFLTDGSMKWRLIRTLTEALLSWLEEYMTSLIAWMNVPEQMRPAIFSLFMMLNTAAIGFINDNKAKEVHNA